MRLFVAVFLAPAVEAGLRELLDELRPRLRGVRWVRPDQLHVTCKFLGEVDDPAVAAVGSALRSVVVPPLRLGVDGCGRFPPAGRPRVFWAGLCGDLAELRRLAAAVEAALSPLGFAAESRPFHPHVTLGRAQPGCRARLEAAPRLAPLPVRGCALMRSTLGADGARHAELLRLG